MKTNKELLEMSGNDLLKYCESLTYFTIDRDDLHNFTKYDIIVTKVEYDKIHKHFKLSYRINHSNIYNDIEQTLYLIEITNCGQYCGLFETEQDAINAAKQANKKEIFEQIDSLKLQIKELEKKIENLKNL